MWRSFQHIPRLHIEAQNIGVAEITPQEYANPCLSLMFNHELEIQSFLANVTEADDELWRSFSPRRDGAHLVASNAGIELEQPECAQEELS